MNVHAQLLKAQQSVDAVVKRGKNTQQNYTYAQASDVIAVCRKALHDAGLYSAIVGVKVKQRRTFASKQGVEGLYVEVRVTLMISTGEVDEPEVSSSTQTTVPLASHLLFWAMGAGADYGGGDKAILKAQTAATKYAYANALALPFSDLDPEKDVEGEPGRLPEQKADPEKALPKERVEELGKLLTGSTVTYERLCLILGSMGANAPKAKRKDSIRKAIGELTEAQATQLANVLDAEQKPEKKADG